MASPLIIVPAYNVEASIGALLDGLHDRLIVVIDDGSPDNTREIVQRRDVPLITHHHNQGVGAALKSGIAYGLDHGFSQAITIDADGQHSPDRIRDVELLLTRSDFVIGNRFHDLAVLPTQKLCSNLLGSIVVQELFGLRIPDAACGFRGFRLGAELLDIEANSYGYVFEQFFALLRRFPDFQLVDIPAIYPMDSLLCTRRSELSGFFQAAIRVCRADRSHHELLEALTGADVSVEQGRDFSVAFGDFVFYAYSIERESAYIIQTEQGNIRKFHRGIDSADQTGFV